MDSTVCFTTQRSYLIRFPGSVRDAIVYEKTITEINNSEEASFFLACLFRYFSEYSETSP